MPDDVTLCNVCGLPIKIGDWPCVNTIREHEPALVTPPFQAYFDIGLGEQVNSFADRWRLMRQKGLQYRDLPRPGDLSARRDRVEQQRREQAR
jgi:hypothetical protein